MDLWEMSATGGILILVILVVRRLFRNRLPGRTFLILWTVALLRLLIPVSVTVPFNAYTLLEICGMSADPEQLPKLFRAAEYREDTQAEVRAGGESRESDFAGRNGMEDEMQSRDSVRKAAEPQRVLYLCRLVYLAGALLTAAYYGLTYLKCCREFWTALPMEDLDVQEFIRSFPVKRRVQVRQTGLVATPMTYGVLRPVILLPKGMEWEGSRQMELVLTHELVHICRFDVVRKLLLATAVCVHWWNPLVWVMYVLASRDMELACDEQVLRYFGQESRKDYALSLISLAERKSNFMSWGNGFGKFPSHRLLPFGRNPMEERIVAIMKKKRFSLAEVAGAAVLVIFVTALFATSTTQKNTEETHLEAQESLDQDTAYSVQENEAQAVEDDRLTIRIPAPHVPYVEGSLSSEETEETYYTGEEGGFINLEELEAQGASGDASETDGAVTIDFPKEYKKYGVTEKGKYKEKQIAVLYDAGHFIYCDGCDGIPGSERVYLLVKRDAKGKITSFEEMTKEEMQKAVEQTGLEL